MTDLKAYYKSLSNEIFSIYNRVRNLANHHGEDGRYKEIMLRKMIKRFLPSDYAVGTGFVATRGSDRTHDYAQTNQIDIIIYNTKYPVLFSEDDFVIVIPEAVRGIIEVKSNLRNLNIESVIEKANRIGNFIMSHRQIERGRAETATPIFNGIFGFDGFMRSFPLYITNKQRLGFINSGPNLNGVVNHIVFNTRYLMKNFGENRIKFYDLPDLALIYFISNLIAYIANIDNLDYSFEQALWFPDDKELKQIITE